MKRLMPFALALALGAGCGRSPQPTNTSPHATPATNPAPAKTTVQEVIDGFTGKTAIDAGMRVKQKVETIRNKAEKDIEEALKP